jgi:hypothetical protein
MKTLFTAAFVFLALLKLIAQTAPAQEPRIIYQSSKQNSSGCSTQGMSSVSQAEADKNAELAFTAGYFKNATGTGNRFCLPGVAPKPASNKKAK